ncbi:hypothetical protein GGR58DRAFT_503857 [Xylaria digitata]|nr:hypothetical protein GGR58DRAFT_503857 [Xylaria digitata]
MGCTVTQRALLALALFAAPCWTVEFATTEISISPGGPFILSWEGAKGPVELSLLTVGPTTLSTVEVINSGDTGDSYTWTPPDDLPSGTYAFGISDGKDMNYSSQWTYKASNNAPASSSSSTLTPTPTSTSTTHTTLSTTTAPTTSPKITASSTSSLTTRSSISLEPTPAASSSANTLPNNIPTSSTTISSTSTSTTSSTTPSTSSESPIGELVESNFTSSSSSSSSTSSAETRTPVTNANGLSTSAKIGIGIGAGLGGLGLLSVAGLLIFRRCRAARERETIDGDTIHRELKVELSSDPWLRAELGGRSLAEMHSNHVIPEVWRDQHDQWRRQPSELDASYYFCRSVDIGKM